MRNKKSIRNLYSIIEEDFNKQLSQLDAYKEIIGRRNEISELIENSFEQEDKVLVEQYIECEADIEYLKVEEYFVKGFSIACQLFFDALR